MYGQLDERLPIFEVADDWLVNKMGDVGIGLEVEKPELYTLGENDYETLHQSFVKGLKALPDGTVLHVQDIYRRERYRAEHSPGGASFLGRASERFFEGRPFLRHQCHMYLIRRPAGRKAVTSASSGLLRKVLVPADTIDMQAARAFEDAVMQFVRILEDSGLMKVRRLRTMELVSTEKKAGKIEQYCYLLDDQERPVIRDIGLGDHVRVGDQEAVMFTLADAEGLPGKCSPSVGYERFSTEKTRFPVGFAAGLGLLLPFDHIYNQYIVLENAGAAMRRLERKRLRLQSLAKYSRENALALEAVNAFLNEAISQQRRPVRFHANVLAWTDQPEELKEIRKRIGSAMAAMDAVAHQETVGLRQLWWAGIPGNGGDLPENECVDTFLEQACCFLGMESNVRSADRGIRFGDRITGKPVNLDLFNHRALTNRGAFVCGSSGGGKSMLCAHIFRSLYDAGGHIVVVDIGGSYKGLCELVGGYYLTYREEDPIRFNPFYLAPGISLDTEKKESLKALLATLWKQEHETFNRSEYVALSNALQGYYARLEGDSSIFPCFNSFYEFLQSDYVLSLKEQGVKDRDFDIENFLYVLRPYFRGGEFDYLLNATENLQLLTERFIVIELDAIKDHPILLPVVSLITMELTMTKMRRIPSVLKAFAIEEAWKPMMQAGMSQFMKYAWKTFRKLYGIPMVVTQEIDDLLSSPIIKEAIIGNSDIKILMDMRKFVNKFDALQSTLGMSEKGKTMLFSVNRANEPGRRYREFYVELGGEVMMVLRYEPSPEEYYTYTTEASEKVKVMEYARRHGSMERGIEVLVTELEHGRRQGK
ncbi:TraG family conjugative transposon ATPase [Flavitalea sp. BT771]|uniref:TraG family conjugative transposon ATPase n=1 Tax=Flavitalea sp. BT771 TaxID=3063329 RepID=UPI0026E1FB3F|nr:TraG family conjugative transposon ATPase [Flavitalea sp. BT771]MDO6431563.1 TraG family conjugative transposon ATPase [Flavitalea sp. BT771]MDV6220471.1 TraG family conjugative transposon ATPase [Flavitalea sp. BT771]